MKPRNVQNADNDLNPAKGQSMPDAGSKPYHAPAIEPEQAVSWWAGGNQNPTAAQVHVAIAIINLNLNSPERLTDAHLILYSALNGKGWTGNGEDCLPFGAESERARGQHERLAEMLATSGAVIEVLQGFTERIAGEELDEPSKPVRDSVSKLNQLILTAHETLEKVRVLISGIDSVSTAKKGVESGLERQNSGGQGTSTQAESPKGVAGGVCASGKTGVLDDYKIAQERSPF